MIKKKIEAYTLMEITVAMLLAAVCMSICYTAYGLINTYFLEFQKKSAISQDVLMLNRTMDRDFLKARYILKTDDGITVESPNQLIFYSFKAHEILRNDSGLRTDSFRLSPININFRFKGHESIATDTIDRLSFDIDVDGARKISIMKAKRYSAQDLFK